MNAHPKKNEPDLFIVVEPWYFRARGQMLLWVVPGYTHFVASLN